MITTCSAIIIILRCCSVGWVGAHLRYNCCRVGYRLFNVWLHAITIHSYLRLGIEPHLSNTCHEQQHRCPFWLKRVTDCPVFSHPPTLVVLKVPGDECGQAWAPSPLGRQSCEACLCCGRRVLTMLLGLVVMGVFPARRSRPGSGISALLVTCVCSHRYQPSNGMRDFYGTYGQPLLKGP